MYRALDEGISRDQGRKLMQVMDSAVNGLCHLQRITAAVRELGRRHVAYGVKDHHCDTVGAALLWALGHGLGREFTPEVRDAWATVYEALASFDHERGGGCRVRKLLGEGLHLSLKAMAHFVPVAMPRGTEYGSARHVRPRPLPIAGKALGD